MLSTLHPKQEACAAFLAARWHAACNGQAGTGKTWVALRAAEMVRARSGLVTCPAHVRRQWLKVIATEFGREALETWHVISYNEAIRKGFGNSRGAYVGTSGVRLRDAYDVFIPDEVHYLKTLESKRTKAVFGRGGLASRARFKWPLSGTMAPNGRPIELYPMLKALAPGFDMRFQTFAQRYCGAYFDGRGMRFDGASHLDELRERLKNFMCHLSLRDIDPDRRRPIVERVPLELTGEDLKAIHEEEERIGMRESTLSPRHEEYAQMGDTSRLLRLLSMAKLRSIIEFVTMTLLTHQKVMVFCHHVDLLDRLNYHFSERSYYPALFRGGMSDDLREMVKHKFLYDAKCRIFLAQEDAVGTGTDGLQRVCSIAIDAEPSWTPGVTTQKLARLDRLGQEDDVVTYYMLYADDTLDDVKSMVHGRKDANIQKMEGTEARIEALWDFV